MGFLPPFHGSGFAVVLYLQIASCWLRISDTLRDVNKGCSGSLSPDHGLGVRELLSYKEESVLLGLWMVLRFLSRGLVEGIRWVAAIKERDAVDSEQNKGELGWYHEEYH